MVSSGAVLSLFAQLNLIPMPRDMKVSEGECRANIVGGQCCNWTEKTANLTELEWKMWPRGLALAEILWTNPDPAKRDFGEFSERAAEHRRRLVREHVNCAPLK